ncbi:hypothetical protein QRX60_30175 [Amycolatopsis mongoliensis]|uniref:YfhO family protein n=1 Tax=Amycolatopsis mongoliensis TaxID=715475 RepID=A0A9Y2JGZ6_9PSEU|nr:hypothetical protein [Amycolatopsis sp. 4-36]WIX98324.1 hypothetical protein QRX60_30175 [Amycolatopsis sp. 4-36]
MSHTLNEESAEAPTADHDAPAPEEKTPRHREWLIVVGVGLAAVVMFSIPWWLHPLFYYVGDNPESFTPLWHQLGEQLRSGHWPVMDPAGWYGGNHAAEGEYSVVNPVQLLNYVVVSWFDNLAAASAVVMVEFLALLAMGVYLLCREYEAGRVPAVLLGLAMPAGGFTLYYAAAGWPLELMALVWVTWFWWAARRYARRRLNPFVPFVLGALAMTTGNPYAALGVLVVLLGLTVELLAHRDFRRLAGLAVLGVLVGASGAVVFLPLADVLVVTSRQHLAMISNDAFQVPHLGDILASSAPTYLPAVVNWNGAVREILPSTYFAWFAIPLLPWLRFGALRHPTPALRGLLAISLIFLALVVGPSNVWLFRWPIRLIEFLYLGLAVLIATLLSAGLATTRVRARAATTVVLVAAGGYLSVAISPEIHWTHAGATAVVLVLVGGALLVHRRFGWRPFGAVLVAGTAIVLAYQTATVPVTGPSGPTRPPVSVSQVRQHTTFATGTVLQLAEQQSVRTQDYADGDLLFGNESILRGHETVNRYSGIGFDALNSALCMNYKGVTCADAFGRLWQPVAGTTVPLVDALRVQTLILQRSLLPAVVDQRPPAGWHVAASDEVRTVWVRSAPPPYPGRVSWASPGVSVQAAEANPDEETVTYQAPADGGQLLFARLNWPGYTVAVDGGDGPAATVRESGAGLVVVDVPPGRHVVRLEFQEPGLRIGLWILLVVTVLASAQAIMTGMSRKLIRRRPTMGKARGGSAADRVGQSGVS